ncbi:M15 family metallopeptidase [Tumidithrix helvetica PCC 7403]|uniref:M15 family metallopeptidase n=1 Tax=Tumidithrix helvetica TaxID=3457545 RepID=UPI003C9522E2
MKPYQIIPIADCGEPLVEISQSFVIQAPHAYQALGAPYGNKSPFYLRTGVCDRLQAAQKFLQTIYAGWQIKVFDAYRPIPVQRFMVEHTLCELAKAQELDREHLSAQQERELMAEVLQFWAIPSDDPNTPPPHSTGAAVDITLVDRDRQEINMGSAIDEISDRSFPNYFQTATSPEARSFHAYRELLCQIMAAHGFQRHPNEWWHFSYGDQMWAWLNFKELGQAKAIAKYGRC